MPAAYHISEDEALITIKAEGDVDLVELFELATSLQADPAYSPDTPLLVDLREMRVTLQAAVVKPFNRFILTHFGPSREASIAVVVDSGMNSELCAAIYWLNCAMGGSEMFEDYDHALKWLIKREFANVL